MGKLVSMSEFEKERNRLFNLGYKTSYEDTDIDLDLYEENTHYRRGYDAGERDREEDIAGDYDAPTREESEALYGAGKDRV